MNIKILVALIVAVLLLAGTNLAGLWSLPGAITPSQPIFCNDFEYITCAEDTLNPTTHSIGPYGYYFCGLPATRCEVQNADVSGYVGESCYVNWLGVVQCAATLRSCAGSCTLNPGEYFVNGQYLQSPTATFRIYEQKLFWCGKSPCSAQAAGVPVQGSSGCSFAPSQIGTQGNVYDQNGNLIDPNYQGIYTVPPGTSYQYTTYALRRQCGDTGETCQADIDCANQHSLKMQINGRWYGVEFVGGQMQFYGCIQTDNICIQRDVLAQGTEKCLQYNDLSYCGVTQFSGVECIPGSDTCGPNAACQQTGPTTFECVPYQQVQCTYDQECGQATSCDWVDRVLRRPYCNNGQCDTENTYVDCCYDVNCPEGWYCDSDYSCKEQVKPKVPCPYTCCVDEMNYVDRPCPPSTPVCCGDHTCAVSIESCGIPPINEEANWNWLWIVILAVLLGSVGYLSAGGVGATIGGIVGGIIGYAIYWFMGLAWWQQWLIGIAGVAGAGILIYILLFGGGFLAVMALIVAMRGRNG